MLSSAQAGARGGDSGRTLFCDKLRKGTEEQFFGWVQSSSNLLSIGIEGNRSSIGAWARIKRFVGVAEARVLYPVECALLKIPGVLYQRSRVVCFIKDRKWVVWAAQKWVSRNCEIFLLGSIDGQ